MAERDLDTAWMLRWGPEFVELLDNPAVSPMLGEVLGAEYRLDHVYSTLLRPAKGDGDPTLCGTSRWHSGPRHEA